MINTKFENMTLEKTIKRTVFQRFKQLVLGKEKPNLLIRVSAISGFVVWLYLVSWHIITFLSLILLGNLKQSKDIRPAYQALGKKYGYIDAITQLKIFSIVEIIIYCVILFGLVLIWRRKKTGLLMVTIGYALSIIIAYLMMGLRFLSNEIPHFDYILIASSIVYFSFGFFFFHRNTKQVATT